MLLQISAVCMSPLFITSNCRKVCWSSSSSSALPSQHFAVCFLISIPSCTYRLHQKERVGESPRGSVLISVAAHSSAPKQRDTTIFFYCTAKHHTCNTCSRLGFVCHVVVLFVLFFMVRNST